MYQFTILLNKQHPTHKYLQNRLFYTLALCEAETMPSRSSETQYLKREVYMVCLTTCFVLRSYFVWLKGSMKNHFKFLQGLKKSFTLSPLTSFLLSDHALLNRVLNLIFSLRLFLSFSSFFFRLRKAILNS